MTKYLAIVLLLVTPAYGSREPIDDEDLAILICSWVSFVAKDTMKARQNGEPLSETLPATLDRLDSFVAEVVEEIGYDISELNDDELAELHAVFEPSMEIMRPILRELALRTYDFPVYSSNSRQKEAINKMENVAFQACYEGVLETE